MSVRGVLKLFLVFLSVCRAFPIVTAALGDTEKVAMSEVISHPEGTATVMSLPFTAPATSVTSPGLSEELKPKEKTVKPAKTEEDPLEKLLEEQKKRRKELEDK